MYHGGKQRIGKELANVIFNNIKADYEIQGYCEPFCGMLGVYRHIPKLFKEQNLSYKAGDKQESIIKMWQEIQNGWVPPTSCTEEKYNELKKEEGSSAEQGYIGHQYSYGGQYFKAFVGKYKGRTIKPNVSEKVYRIGKELEMVDFTYGSYTQFKNLKNYIIYCDPPYANTRCYYNKDYSKSKFDNTSFWNWCREMSKDNIVFVSEYNAPEDFECIYENEKKNNIFKYKTTGTEKIFTLKR